MIADSKRPAFCRSSGPLPRRMQQLPLKCSLGIVDCKHQCSLQLKTLLGSQRWSLRLRGEDSNHMMHMERWKNNMTGTTGIPPRTPKIWMTPEDRMERRVSFRHHPSGGVSNGEQLWCGDDLQKMMKGGDKHRSMGIFQKLLNSV